MHAGQFPSSPLQCKAGKRRLGPLAEQLVIRAGFLAWARRLAVEECTSLLELPRRPDGSHKLLRPSFWQRLLSNEVELQRSMSSDVTAAQSDMKHLSLEQLLIIRIRTFDFVTESKSHEAHCIFLEKLDRCFFESAASRIVCDKAKVLQSSHASGEDQSKWRRLSVKAISWEGNLMYYLGVYVTCVLGAWDLLLNESDKIPELWAFRLDAGKICYQGNGDTTQCALLNMQEKALYLYGGNPEALIDGAGGDQVCVLVDRSTGVGKNRQISWEVAITDPTCGETLEALARAEKAGVSTSDKFKLAHCAEMALALKRRGKPVGEENEENDNLGERAVVPKPQAALSDFAPPPREKSTPAEAAPEEAAPEEAAPAAKASVVAPEEASPEEAAPEAESPEHALEEAAPVGEAAVEAATSKPTPLEEQFVDGRCPDYVECEAEWPRTPPPSSPSFRSESPRMPGMPCMPAEPSGKPSSMRHQRRRASALANAGYNLDIKFSLTQDDEYPPVGRRASAPAEMQISRSILSTIGDSEKACHGYPEATVHDVGGERVEHRVSAFTMPQPLDWGATASKPTSKYAMDALPAPSVLEPQGMAPES